MVSFQRKKILGMVHFSALEASLYTSGKRRECHAFRTKKGTSFEIPLVAPTGIN